MKPNKLDLKILLLLKGQPLKPSEVSEIMEAGSRKGKAPHKSTICRKMNDLRRWGYSCRVESTGRHYLTQKGLRRCEGYELSVGVA